jgi:hypothetical protein
VGHASFDLKEKETLLRRGFLLLQCPLLAESCPSTHPISSDLNVGFTP